MSSEAVAVVVFAVVTCIVGAAILFISEILGPRRQDPEKTTIYECGVPLLDTAHQPFTIKFYLFAILFILFDIETVFLIPYAVLYRGMGMVGLGEMLVFLVILGIGLIYCWKRGALEWE